MLRLESSGAQPAMISSSYTSESQALHKEQLESRICGREEPPPQAQEPRLCPPAPASASPEGRWGGVCMWVWGPSVRKGLSSLPGKAAARTQGCH